MQCRFKDDILYPGGTNCDLPCLLNRPFREGEDFHLLNIPVPAQSLLLPPNDSLTGACKKPGSGPGFMIKLFFLLFFQFILYFFRHGEMRFHHRNGIRNQFA